MSGLRDSISLDSTQIIFTIALWNLSLNEHVTDDEVMMILGMTEDERENIGIMRAAILAAQQNIEASLQDAHSGEN